MGHGCVPLCGLQLRACRRRGLPEMFFATAPNTLAARADVSICPGLKILFLSLLGNLLNGLFRNRKLHYGPQRVRQRDNQIMNNPRNYLIRASCLVGLFGVAGKLARNDFLPCLFGSRCGLPGSRRIFCCVFVSGLLRRGYCSRLGTLFCKTIPGGVCCRFICRG